LDHSQKGIILRIYKFTAVTAVALGLAFGATPASATFINGSIGFADGFSGVSTPVSTAPFFDVNSSITEATLAIGDFATFVVAPPVGVTSAGDIDTNAPGGTLYAVGGFTFSFQSITDDTNQLLSCFAGLCTDSRTLTITGAVSGNGFEDTAYIGVWSANGACLDSSGACAPSSYSATWSSSIVALGIAVPEPGSVALVSIGLAGLGWSRRDRG
jgi:hypothetical protein